MIPQPRIVLRMGLNRIRRVVGLEPLVDKSRLCSDLKQAGQIVVIFALMLTVLIGLVGIAIDTTYAWRESLRVQRASDAAALAGVVYMPGNDGGALARKTATAEANKNGLKIVDPTTISFPAAANPRELDVTITTPVPTFFSRIFGINSFTVSRSSKSVYVTPVPMGSPLAYFGTYQLCSKADVCKAQTTSVAGGGTLGVSISSQGFFGAIEGQGSNRSTGDAYATYYNPYSTKNTQYNDDGYRYIVEGGSAGGSVYLFDPMFCATVSKTSGHSGAGDHWLGTPTPVSTYYILYDTHNTPLAPKTWTATAHLSETNQNTVDMGGTYGNNSTTNFGGYGDGSNPIAPTDCQNSVTGSNSHHNQWVLLSAVAANETYSLRVTTTDPNSPNANLSQTFENMFSIAVTGGGRVYGSGAMVTYANVESGSQDFYLAQIDRTAGAGKTIEIDLFDVGDVGAASWVQILPDGSPAWQPTTFRYTADANGGNRHSDSTTCLQAFGGSGTAPSGCGEKATSGGQFYQNSWVSIMITLPTTYGDASHPLTQNGWWKIRYTVSKANDTTTWQVSIRGNPVHLI